MTVTKFPKGRVLTALNAELTTATISVEVMKLDKRQVTLSVFRQLFEEPIFDWQAMALRGVGWGYVNYQLDEGRDVAVHLVWQRGSELLRCKLHRRVGRYNRYGTLDNLLFRMDGEDRDAFVANVCREVQGGYGTAAREFVAGDTIATPWGPLRPSELDARRSFPDFVLKGFSEPYPQYADAGDLVQACREAASTFGSRASACVTGPRRKSFPELLMSCCRRFEKTKLWWSPPWSKRRLRDGVVYMALNGRRQRAKHGGLANVRMTSINRRSGPSMKSVGRRLSRHIARRRRRHMWNCLIASRRNTTNTRRLSLRYSICRSFLLRREGAIRPHERLLLQAARAGDPDRSGGP